MHKLIVITLLICTIVFCCFPTIQKSSAATSELSNAEIYNERLQLYKEYEAITFIPWYYLAAVDTYERNVRRTRSDIPKKTNGVIEIYFTEERWLENEITPTFAQDGDGDGKRDRMNDRDVLFAMAHYIQSYGITEEYIRMALWDYYERDVSVSSIMSYAKIYAKHDRIDLTSHVLPMPKGYNWTIKANYGDRRSFGGRRMHEGVDIFAGYGVPIRSTSYGIVELKGWNRFGGWRIGIRDLQNNYQYYAHMSGYSKDLEVGTVVEPGTIIGWCGSSGYGPPGTSGKFPPHLHYGIYHDNGKNEWSVNPYYYLSRWRQEEYSKK
ncbi:MAG: M23 family metallopeptidase [Bacilli bacterium]